MGKKLKKLFVFFIIYGLVFLIGFRAGQINKQLYTKTKVETIEIPQEHSTKYYFSVEKLDCGDYTRLEFRRLNETDIEIKFLFNEKLKPLLKRRDLEIYSEEGERLF